MEFLSPNNALKKPGFPLNETTLRRMIHEGKVPGIHVGRNFLINYPAFMEALDAQSRANVKDAAAAT